MHANKDVDDVEKIAGVIQEQPSVIEFVLEIPEDRAANDKYQVVNDGAIYYSQPLKIRL